MKGQPLAGVHVLICEDQEDTALLFTFILEEHGATVTATSTVRGTLDVIEQVQPDILLLDLSLPDGSGLTLLSEIRKHSNPAIRAIPAIAISGYNALLDGICSREAAADFQIFLQKPIELEELVKAVALLADVADLA